MSRKCQTLPISSFLNERVCVFSQFYIFLMSLGFKLLVGQKTSNLLIPLWPLGTCNSHFSLFYRQYNKLYFTPNGYWEQDTVKRLWGFFDYPTTKTHLSITDVFTIYCMFCQTLFFQFNSLQLNATWRRNMRQSLIGLPWTQLPFTAGVLTVF